VTWDGKRGGILTNAVSLLKTILKERPGVRGGINYEKVNEGSGIYLGFVSGGILVGLQQPNRAAG